MDYLVRTSRFWNKYYQVRIGRDWKDKKKKKKKKKTVPIFQQKKLFSQCNCIVQIERGHVKICLINQVVIKTENISI